jgi:hypothetical protein
MGVRPPYLLSLTKLAGKIFFPAYSNDLIYKNIFSGLNRWDLKGMTGMTMKGNE